MADRGAAWIELESGGSGNTTYVTVVVEFDGHRARFQVPNITRMVWQGGANEPMTCVLEIAHPTGGIKIPLDVGNVDLGALLASVSESRMASDTGDAEVKLLPTLGRKR